MKFEEYVNKIPKELIKAAETQLLSFFLEFPGVRFPTRTILFSTISVESSWNPKADSGFARGLGQISDSMRQTINKIYGTNYSYDDLFDPAINLWFTVRALRYLDRQFMDVPEQIRLIYILLAYNYGIENVRRWLINSPTNLPKISATIPQESKDYLIRFGWFYFNWHRLNTEK